MTFMVGSLIREDQTDAPLLPNEPNKTSRVATNKIERETSRGSSLHFSIASSLIYHPRVCRS